MKHDCGKVFDKNLLSVTRTTRRRAFIVREENGKLYGNIVNIEGTGVEYETHWLPCGHTNYSHIDDNFDLINIPEGIFKMKRVYNIGDEVIFLHNCVHTPGKIINKYIGSIGDTPKYDIQVDYVTTVHEGIAEFLIESINNNPEPPVNHEIKKASHYNSLGAKCVKCKYPIEAHYVTEYFPGNITVAMNYMWRADFKGNPIKDYKKAIQHLEYEIEKRQRDTVDTDNNTK